MRKGRKRCFRPFRFLPELGRSMRQCSVMGMLDTVLRETCHDINGIVAVQHMELNFARRGTKAALFYALVACANPAFAGTITHPNPPDPLLDGGPTTACAARPDYAQGQD